MALLLLLVLSITSTAAQAQSFVYIGADPSSAEGDFMNSAAGATINGEPFWEAMEPYIGRVGACQDPSNSKDVANNEAAAGPIIQQSTVDLIIAGFEQSKNWLTGKSLWPLKHHILMPTDPKAPQAIPIFCSLTASPMKNHLVDLIETAGADGTASFFLITGLIPEFSQYRDQDLSTAASRALISTLHDDNVQAVFYRADNRFFDSDLDVSEQSAQYKSYERLVSSLFTAMTYTVLETEFGFGPSVTNRFVGPTSTLSSIDFYHLAGSYNEPFYQIPKTSASNSTSAALWHFLLDGYLEVGFESAADLLYTLATSSNQLAALNDFINRHDGEFHTGLVHAIPNFSSAVANWSYYRKYGQVGNWKKRLFGSCKQVTLSENKTVYELDLQLQPYSSACLEVDFEPGDRGTMFDAHIKVTTGDANVNGIELGIIEARKSELSRMADSPNCYKHAGFQTSAEGTAKIERRGIATTKTCLHAFGQGKDPKSDELQRYFYLVGEDAGNTQDLTARQSTLIVSYTPDDHLPFTGTNANPVDTKIVFSVDTAQLQSVLFDEAEVESVFASKSGSMPVTPLATEKTSSFDDSVLEGRATAVDPSFLQSAATFSDNRVGLRDQHNTAIEFQFVDPSIIDSKAIGKFDVIPIFQKDGFLAIPDSEKPSKIDIIKHDKDTLYFEADAYICMMEPSEIMASMEQRYLDICTEGERHKVTSTAHVPFPDQFRSESRIVWEETDNYRASRAIRLNQIKQKFAANGLGGITSAQTTTTPGSAPSQATNRGEGANLCGLKQASGACDCSCEVSLCLLAQPAIADSAAGLSCRLSCGKKWRACAQ